MAFYLFNAFLKSLHTPDLPKINSPAFSQACMDRHTDMHAH